MSDEIENALRDFRAASAKLAKCPTMRGGGQAAEKEYAEAYQRLVRLGVQRQLRSKYR
jgi:hypothetical protein